MMTALLIMVGTAAATACAAYVFCTNRIKLDKEITEQYFKLYTYRMMFGNKLYCN